MEARCTPPLHIPESPELNDMRECAQDYWLALLHALWLWHVCHHALARHLVYAFADALLDADTRISIFTRIRTTHKRGKSEWDLRASDGPPQISLYGICRASKGPAETPRLIGS